MPETLEAEIIEIDGRPPPQPESGSGPEARRFDDGVPWLLQLDRRWWPLWLLLGGVVLVAGVFFGALYLIFALLRLLFRLVFGAWGKP